MKHVRWILFAEAFGPSATFDVVGQRRDLEEAEFYAGDPRPEQVKMHKRLQLGQARLQIADAVKGREAARKTLWPPDADEPEG